MTDEERLILLVVLLIIAAAVIYFELKYIRGKKIGKKIASYSVKKDKAFNTLHTTKAVRNKLRLDRINTSKADYLIQKAESALERGDFDSCEEICSSARDELIKSKREEATSIAGMPAAAHDEFPGRIDNETSVIDQPISQIPSKDECYIQAKFELNAARDELDLYCGPAEIKALAAQLVGEAEQLFETEDYRKSLSCSFKARKQLSGEASDKKPPVGSIEKIKKDVPGGRDETVCSKCGKSVEKDDLFCGACGASMKEQKCSSCGAVIRVGDAFCRKCGNRS